MTIDEFRQQKAQLEEAIAVGLEQLRQTDALIAEAEKAEAQGQAAPTEATAARALKLRLDALQAAVDDANRKLDSIGTLLSGALPSVDGRDSCLQGKQKKEGTL